MKINIIYNDKKGECKKIAEDSAYILKSSAVNTDIYDLTVATDPDKGSDVFRSADIIAVVGGDGTILKVAKIAAESRLPIVGINAGRLGYLACIGADDLSDLKRLVVGDFTVENRAMILAEWFEEETLIGSCHCLNDAVISHGAVTTIIDLKVSLDNDKFGYRADGIIAATPSGSTAYSMSAGGPIVDPTLDCFLLTPICPHTLINRPLVVNSTKTVEITVDSSKNAKIYLSCDGENKAEIRPGNTVKISRSDVTAKFIKLGNVSVYKVFSEKTKNI